MVRLCSDPLLFATNATATATYSDSIDDNPTVLCFLDNQAIDPLVSV